MGVQTVDFGVLSLGHKPSIKAVDAVPTADGDEDVRFVVGSAERAHSHNKVHCPARSPEGDERTDGGGSSKVVG